MAVAYELEVIEKRKKKRVLLERKTPLAVTKVVGNYEETLAQVSIYVALSAWNTTVPLQTPNGFGST